ncbi:putative relication initiation protein [Yersinia enterocolitica]|uniref:DUF5405 family protein n=1 Tax=Yersinia enterocolitica TaxID=630 RepID=UPI0005DA8FC6|nr:DUF5405 family protein [Yersinia enterocolitica]CNF49121.1 putative relication initiation protein [Yersinia enterocolitica]
MNIKIGEKHVVTSDSLQFILNEVKISKEGKNKGQERLEPIGYYPTISQLVEGLIKRHVSEAQINSFASLGNEIGRIGKLCQEAFSSSSLKVKQ